MNAAICHYQQTSHYLGEYMLAEHTDLRLVYIRQSESQNKSFDTKYLEQANNTGLYVLRTKNISAMCSTLKCRSLNFENTLVDEADITAIMTKYTTPQNLDSRVP